MFLDHSGQVQALLGESAACGSNVVEKTDTEIKIPSSIHEGRIANTSRMTSHYPTF